MEVNARAFPIDFGFSILVHLSIDDFLYIGFGS